MFCKKKVSVHNQIYFRLFKTCLSDEYENAMVQVIFANYEKYSNVNKAYNNFFHDITSLLRW